jgi:carboxymethylenebutenolidase
MRRHALLFTVLAIACAPADDQSSDDFTQARPPAGPRVALSPTGPDEMPPAILGLGGNLDGTDLQYYAGHPETVGYLAVPEGEGPFPALIVIHEWNGLVDRVRQVADDLAAEGYVTLAADLYSSRTGSNPEENMALVQETRGDMDEVIANLNAAAAYLRGRPDVTGRVGAMGWCFGGGIALTYGLDGDDHEATAIFYGALSDDPEVLATLNHEVYGSFGQLDSGPSPEQVNAFEAALEEAGIEHDLHIYDGVGHAFWLQVEAEPEARTEPGLDAWQRLKAYLDRTLGG